MKNLIHRLGLKLICLFSTEIRDCTNGKRLGRGLVVGWGGSASVLGYKGRPLIPVFPPQKRLSFWKQRFGFTCHPDPDFPRVSGEGKPTGNRVLNLVVTHRGGDAFRALKEAWRRVCPEEDLWFVFGGSREDFESLETARKVFVDDPQMRTRDHQREKQSYAGLLKAVTPIIEREAPDYVHLCEYDHLPAVADLNERQVEVMRAERADLLAHYLVRTDGTNHPIALSHESDPAFARLWSSITRRDGSPAVFWMFGSGSCWTRDAFLAVAKKPLGIRCYFEIHLPTLAHHQGFRIRCWDEKKHLITNLPSSDVTLEEAVKRGAWTVHPVK